MIKCHFIPAIFFLGFAAIGHLADATTYKAKSLRPMGFEGVYGTGISGTSQVGYGYGSASDFSTHPLLWNGTVESLVDLFPTGSSYFNAEAEAVSGGSQVGRGSDLVTGDFHALLWNGTAASVVDLHPTGFKETQAHGVSGASQVGVGFGPVTNAKYHALLWHGTAESVIDLHPAGFVNSFGAGISGTSQVGFADKGNTSTSHAFLWNGTGASAVDLNPDGYDFSQAFGIADNSQVGIASPDGAFGYHAFLWRGSATAFVDLHPQGYEITSAAAVSSAGQVGQGYGDATNGEDHALHWTGTADSVIDLHSFLDDLGIEFIVSIATGISDAGEIFGYAYGNDYNPHPILWTPVPEPGTGALVAIGLFAATLIAHRNRPG